MYRSRGRLSLIKCLKHTALAEESLTWICTFIVTYYNYRDTHTHNVIHITFLIRLSLLVSQNVTMLHDGALIVPCVVLNEDSHYVSHAVLIFVPVNVQKITLYMIPHVPLHKTFHVIFFITSLIRILITLHMKSDV